MTAVLHNALVVLRPEGRGQISPRQALALIVAFGLLYGAMMGTFYGEDQLPRLRQAIYSATKVPLLLMFTCVLALPTVHSRRASMRSSRLSP